MKLYIRSSSDYGIPTIRSIDELIEELESGEYNYYGLRGLTRHNISQISRGYLDSSFDWDFENDVKSDEYLDGTSAVVVSDTMTEKQIANSVALVKRQYNFNGVIALIAGDSGEYGDDEDEIIISCDGRGADIVALIDIA